MTTFLEITKFMKFDPNQTHIPLFGLRIKPFESQSGYQSNANPPDPQICYIKFKIDQKSNGPNRPHCPLNLAISRMTLFGLQLGLHECQRVGGPEHMLMNPAFRAAETGRALLKGQANDIM